MIVIDDDEIATHEALIIQVSSIGSLGKTLLY